MKQIFNWTVGSFFRTIGRIIAFFVVGTFVAYLLARSNIDWGKLNIFSMKVYAKENYTGWTNWYMSNGSSPTYYGSYITQTYTGNNNTQNVFNFYFKSDKTGISTNDADYFEVNMIYNMYVAQNELSFTETDQHTCTVNSQYHELGPVDPYETDYEYEVKSFTCPSVSSQTETYTQNPLFMYQARIYYTDGNWSACKIQECSQNVCTLHCDINGHYAHSVNEIRWLYGINNWNTSITGNYKLTLGMSGAYFFTISDSTEINNSINSQTQQQQQQHNETISTITDTNTTSENSEATNFVTGYNETAQDSVKAVIGAPLAVFNALTTGSTDDLCFTLRSKQVCFPSGNIIWGKTTRTSFHFEGATATPTWFGSGSISTGITLFKSLFNAVVCGYLCYKVLMSIMRITNDMMNPVSDKIERLKL